MAKAIYLGVDGKARKAKKMYIGVGGKARKVRKVYAGVDGKAKLVFSDIPVTGIELSWRIYDPQKSSAVIGGVTDGYARFYAKVIPQNATDKLVWSASGSCTVSGGIGGRTVSPRGSGTSYLTVTSESGITARVRIVTGQKNVAGKSVYYVSSVTKV